MTVPTSQSSGTSTAVRTAIDVRGLRKSYGDQVVLDGIDLSVPEGQVFALLGPNGAGKTTAVRVLSTLTSPDDGEIHVAGYDVRREALAVRSVIGVTGQFSAVDNYLSAEENLLLMADLWHLPRREGRERAAELLGLFDLADTGRKPVFAFSGGMQRRLDLAMTLVGRPRIIFLDEPTTGLDPRGRVGMWDLIRNLVRTEATTILLTTQYLEEADQLADQVAVLDGGKIVALGTAEELKRRVPGGHLVLNFTSRTAFEAAAARFDGATRNDEDLTLQVPNDTSARSVLEVLNRIDVDEVPHISLHTPDLNDVFLALTGQQRKASS
ncbi:ATP-binding cassette domain-containing protein [Sphaerisporangium aureirubrum]|uniref:ATP-binding cassette domain-containing protein n=1 Tax=Sphaerisporangium aureirubrum TaxID=1544736 RepID=A0ABW1NPM5_9ACTN